MEAHYKRSFEKVQEEIDVLRKTGKVRLELSNAFIKNNNSRHNKVVIGEPHISDCKC